MLTFLKQISVLLLLSTSAFASIGSVNELKGKGEIDRKDGDAGIQLEQDLDVFSYDTVKTGNGRVGIKFLDDTKVELTEHSKLIIDDFVYDPNTNTGSLSLKASLGSVRYASGQIAKKSPQNIKILTPTATISVRGTDFAMIIDELGGSTILLLPSCDASGLCYVGEISVESDAGQVILNEAFQATRVESREFKPFKPVFVDIDENMISNLLIISFNSAVNMCNLFLSIVLIDIATFSSGSDTDIPILLDPKSNPIKRCLLSKISLNSFKSSIFFVSLTMI